MTGGSIWGPLRTRDYRRLWIGQTVSIVGDKVNQIAMGVMVYKLTGSLVQMGVMLGITVLPAALFSLFAGAFVDRWHRGRTMFVSDLLRAGLVLLVPLVVPFGIGYAYVIAFLVATVSLFFEPAKLSLIPELVPADELMAANSLDNASFAGAELFGLALGGLIVAQLGYGGAFAFDAATYVVSAVFIALLASHSGASPAARAVATSLSQDVREGLAYMWRQPVLRDLVAVYTFAVVGGGASITLGYLLALDRYANAGPVESARLAILDTAITIGLLIGTLLIGRTGSGRVGAKFLFGLVVYGVAFGAIAFIPSLWPALPLLMVAGMANMWFQVPMATMLQQQTTEEVRGRVFAARLTVVRIGSVVGLTGAGFAAQRLGIPFVVGCVGALIMLAGAVGYMSPALRSA